MNHQTRRDIVGCLGDNDGWKSQRSQKEGDEVVGCSHGRLLAMVFLSKEEREHSFCDDRNLLVLVVLFLAAPWNQGAFRSSLVRF